jgi:hypothetical protein
VATFCRLAASRFPVTLYLPHKPQGDQFKYFNLSSRHTVGVIGRQYGKSTLGTLRMVRKVTSTKDANHYWVSPIVSQARTQFERLLKDYRTFLTKINRTHMEAQFVSGGWAHYKGSDDPTSIKSDTLTGATLDECGTMHDSVWAEAVRPMLAVRRGGCDFIGTPKGKNWFYLLAEQAKRDDEFSFHHAPSNASPFFNSSEFEKIRATTSEAIFRQEYLAEFLESGSEVFRDFRECVQGVLEPPRTGALYLIGADIAKHVDWTVLTVWDVERRHLVAFERFNQIDWPLIEGRIAALAMKYNRARVRLDATGVGDPVYDRLNRAGLNVSPVKITAPVKTHLVESLIFAIEKREITFPHLPEIVHELSIFEAKKTPKGHVQYSAPAGYHDDVVMSMALAVSELVGGSAGPEFYTAE